MAVVFTKELIKELDVKVIGAWDYSLPYMDPKEVNDITYSDVESFKGLEKKLSCAGNSISESFTSSGVFSMSRSSNKVSFLSGYFSRVGLSVSSSHRFLLIFCIHKSS